MAIDLDALEAVLAKATQGEWAVNAKDAHYQEWACWIYAGPLGIVEAQDANDAAAIVALHNTAPALIAEHRALLARVEELEGALSALVVAVTYADPPELFNGVLCHEARVPVEFVHTARAALEPKP